MESRVDRWIKIWILLSLMALTFSMIGMGIGAMRMPENLKGGFEGKLDDYLKRLPLVDAKIDKLRKNYVNYLLMKVGYLWEDLEERKGPVEYKDPEEYHMLTPELEIPPGTYTPPYHFFKIH